MPILLRSKSPLTYMVAESYRVLSTAFLSPPTLSSSSSLRITFMYPESYSFQYISSESADGGLPFFAPPPPPADAPSPESFDREVDEEVAELDSWNFDQFDDFLFNFQNNVSAISASPSLSYSTDSTFGIDSSLYSYDPSPSVLSSPSDIESGSSVENGLYTMHDAVYLAVFSDGPLPFLPVNPVEAQSDYGVSDLVAPGGIPVTQQRVVPTPIPVSVRPDPEAKTTQNKPFKCPQCSFGMAFHGNFISGSPFLPASARKHNLKTHIGTHDKERSKRFGCSTCQSRFSRKHDLHRHRVTMHGDRMSSSSVSSISDRRFDPKPGPDIPQYGDQWLTSSAYADSFLDLHPTGVPEDPMAWYSEAFLHQAV